MAEYRFLFLNSALEIIAQRAERCADDAAALETGRRLLAARGWASILEVQEAPGGRLVATLMQDAAG